jgi:hypothetical protein
MLRYRTSENTRVSEDTSFLDNPDCIPNGIAFANLARPTKRLFVGRVIRATETETATEMATETETETEMATGLSHHLQA